MLTDEIHVYPADDLITHEADSCICGPKLVVVQHEDGTYAWTRLHWPLDGRHWHD